MKKLLLALVSLTPLALLAQVTGSTSLTVGTPQSLLSGCTVSSSNSPNCSIPSGWTLAVADGFDNGALGSSTNEYLVPGESITTANPHSGSDSLACNITGDGAACQLGIFPNTVTSGSNHIYLSFWRYMGTNACGDTEIYFWDVYTDSRSTFFDVEDTQNYTSPLNTCVSSMQPAMIGDGSLDIFADVTGKSWSLPKGTWEQVEGEFQGSTCNGNTSNNDGLYRVYVNGVLIAQHLNFNLNGCGTGASSTGMAVEMGGIFTYLNASNASISAPNGSFPVYIDDVILLKQ